MGVTNVAGACRSGSFVCNAFGADHPRGLYSLWRWQNSDRFAASYGFGVAFPVAWKILRRPDGKRKGLKARIGTRMST